MTEAPPLQKRSSAVARGDGVRAGLRFVAYTSLVVVALSLLLRLTVKDDVPGLAAVFFATPLVVDTFAAAGAAIVLARTGRRRSALVAGALAALCGVLYAQTSFVRNEPRRQGALRGVFWNVQHGARGWSGVVDTLTGLDADVAFLAESDARGGPPDDRLRAAVRGGTLVRSSGGLAVVVRGSAKVVGFQHWEFRSRVARWRVDIDGRAFTLVFPDLAASPFSRGRPVVKVRKFVEPDLGGPLLVVGDFNTPRDSIDFDAWRGPLAHAFETSGRGLDATWPTPVPVLSLDHVWAGGGIAVRTCELPWTTASDHLPVVFTFDLP